MSDEKVSVPVDLLRKFRGQLWDCCSIGWIDDCHNSARQIDQLLAARPPEQRTEHTDMCIGGDRGPCNCGAEQRTEAIRHAGCDYLGYIGQVCNKCNQVVEQRTEVADSLPSEAEILQIRACLDDGTYTELERKDFRQLCDLALLGRRARDAEVVAYFRSVGTVTPDSPNGPPEYDEEFELMMADEIDEKYKHLFYPLIAKPKAK